MKLYEGKPGSPCRVLVRTQGSAKGKPIKFRDGNTPLSLSWGPNDLATAWIAMAILDDLLGDQDRATRLYQRFKHRVAPNWKPGCAWSLTDDEVLGIVKDIESVEVQTAPMRRMVQLEPTPIVSDRGADVQWDNEPKLVSNLKRDG